MADDLFLTKLSHVSASHAIFEKSGNVFMYVHSVERMLIFQPASVCMADVVKAYMVMGHVTVTLATRAACVTKVMYKRTLYI